LIVYAGVGKTKPAKAESALAGREKCEFFEEMADLPKGKIHYSGKVQFFLSEFN
jgi:hypothetical protein